MRISTRLALLLAVAFATIMAIYAAVSLQQRIALLRGALINETGTLAETLRIVTNNALRDRRFRDLDRVFQEVVGDPETVVAAVAEPRGRILAGGVTGDSACLRRILSEAAALPSRAQGWEHCETRVRWVVLPAATPAASVIVARRATVIDREIAASRWRLLLLTLVLTGVAALIVHLVLRRVLSAPLAELMRGIRSLGSEQSPEPMRVSPAAGELHHLAGAFNTMVGEMRAREQRLIQGTEERVALERRLSEAEKFAVIGRLSGGLAHELGSPLNVIGMRAEAIAMDREAPERTHRHAEAIVEEVDRISQLVRGLLLVGRRHGVRPEPVVLQDVLRGLLDHAAPYTTGAGVEVRAELPEQPIVVRGQATLLRHAILNLVRNAAQAVATQPGEHRLSIVLEQTETGVRVVVDDTGPGIPEEHLPKIFEPFYSTKDVGEGTGLGLAVSRGIAEEHGGDLQLDNREGGGVRAVLTLPAVDLAAAGEASS